jgi:hypothetical protein
MEPLTLSDFVLGMLPVYLFIMYLCIVYFKEKEV